MSPYSISGQRTAERFDYTNSSANYINERSRFAVITVPSAIVNVGRFISAANSPGRLAPSATKKKKPCEKVKLQRGLSGNQVDGLTFPGVGGG